MTGHVDRFVVPNTSPPTPERKIIFSVVWVSHFAVFTNNFIASTLGKHGFRLSTCDASLFRRAEVFFFWRGAAVITRLWGRSQQRVMMKSFQLGRLLLISFLEHFPLLRRTNLRWLRFHSNEWLVPSSIRITAQVEFNVSISPPLPHKSTMTSEYYRVLEFYIGRSRTKRWWRASEPTRIRISLLRETRAAGDKISILALKTVNLWIINLAMFPRLLHPPPLIIQYFHIRSRNPFKNFAIAQFPHPNSLSFNGRVLCWNFPLSGTSCFI